jgi:hypothetical protein
VNNDPVNFVDLWGLSAGDRYNDYLNAGTAPELVFTAPDPTPQIPSTWNDYANALEKVAGAEMAGAGGMIAAGGAAVIADAIAVGTAGAIIGGGITGLGFVAIGAGIIGMDIDLLEGTVYCGHFYLAL